MNLDTIDPEIAALLQCEEERQSSTLGLIPSESYASAAVRQALGSALTNKYSEGYPGERYYQGNEFADRVERLAIERIKQLFDAPYANVQAHSGSPANLAVYLACMQPGDTLMGLALAFGGHLTHGDRVSVSGTLFKPVQFGLRTDGYIDVDQAYDLARRHRPRVIVLGTTAYPRSLPWVEFAEIARDVGAHLHADVSHIAGLICAGVEESPVRYADSVMFTTHKTFRGPRGAVILATEKGLQRDPELGRRIDKWVFPGLQGGPHDNVTAAIAVAAKEAEGPAFRADQYQTVANARALGHGLDRRGFRLISGGTDTHLLLVDLQSKGINGRLAAVALEQAGIVCNRNAIPDDPMPPFYPSGIRMGTPTVTLRGMREAEMEQIAGWIDAVVEATSPLAAATNVKSRSAREAFAEATRTLPALQEIRAAVAACCRRFPLP